MRYKVTRPGVYDEKGNEIEVGTVITAEPRKNGDHPKWLKNKAEQVGGSGKTLVTNEGEGEGDGSKSPSGQERQTLLKDTASKLKSFEFTSDNRPDLRALNAALPEGSAPFTGEERDNLWPTVKDQVNIPTA